MSDDKKPMAVWKAVAAAGLVGALAGTLLPGQDMFGNFQSFNQDEQASDSEFDSPETQAEVEKFNARIEARKKVFFSPEVDKPQPKFDGKSIRQKCATDNPQSQNDASECVFNRTKEAINETLAATSFLGETAKKLGQHYNTCSGITSPLCAIEKTWGDKDLGLLYRSKFAFVADKETFDTVAVVAMFAGVIGLAGMGSRIYRREKDGAYDQDKNDKNGPKPPRL